MCGTGFTYNPSLPDNPSPTFVVSSPAVWSELLLLFLMVGLLSHHVISLSFPSFWSRPLLQEIFLDHFCLTKHRFPRLQGNVLHDGEWNPEPHAAKHTFHQRSLASTSRTSLDVIFFFMLILNDFFYLKSCACS